MTKRLYNTPDDFEAQIRIYRKDEGGRKTPVFNGIRWDLAYADNEETGSTLYMIWPDFFDSFGDSLSVENPLPIDKFLSARMTILVDEMREEVHRKQISEGVKFFCHEGSRRVAEGIVTKITGLFDPR